MNVAIDKTSVVILIIVVLLTAGIVVVLRGIRSPTTASVTIACEQIDFDTVAEGGEGTAVSLFDTGLWIESVRLEKWQQLVFRVPAQWETAQSRRLADAGLVTVEPATANAQIEIVSDPESFSLRDLFLDGSARISWRVNGPEQHVAIRSSAAVSTVLSAGDSLRLRLVDCTFVGRSGSVLSATKPEMTEEVTCPVSFARRDVRVLSKTGQIELEARLQSEVSSDPVVLLRDVEISHAVCAAEEYTPAGRLRSRNTLVRGSVHRPEYGADDEYEIRSGESFDVEPSDGHLEAFVINGEFAEASIVYQARSLVVGSFQRAQHQLIRSKLDEARSNELLILIYTLSLGIFGFLTKFLLRKKDG